jgi:hypothetical protein
LVFLVRLGDLSPPPIWVLIGSIAIGIGMILAGSLYLGIVLIGLMLLLSAPRLISRLRRR